jgi:NCAIR mutase (PurE)-related protein
LATRISPEQAAALEPLFPGGSYNPLARTFRVGLTSAEDASRPVQGHVAVVTAGTSDLPVAEEARETALWTGARVTFVQDVGVAGPHRLPARLPEIAGADAVVVVAGMEGALPSVVGGYVDCPVIAVPTSVGYGANLGGIAALLSMLNSCAANVAVVNIDAGFKGGYLAGLIARNAHRSRSQA